MAIPSGGVLRPSGLPDYTDLPPAGGGGRRGGLADGRGLDSSLREVGAVQGGRTSWTQNHVDKENQLVEFRVQQGFYARRSPINHTNPNYPRRNIGRTYPFTPKRGMASWGDVK